jgi:hypothetical protein
MASLLKPNDDEYWEAVELIQQALDDLILSGRKPEAIDFRPAKALDFILAYGKLYQVGGYLVAYVIDTPWYADGFVLNELLVLRNGRGGKFSDVTDFFEQEARRLGCHRISTGTLLSVDNSTLGSLYERQGYHCGAWQMCKEIG